MAVKLRREKLDISVLFLDPNNPRFFDLDVQPRVPMDRIHEESVQGTAFNRMIDERFDVDQLKESIKHKGFLSELEPLVAVELPTSGKYVVIEGNRRLTALRSLLQDEGAGDIDLDKPIKDSIERPDVVIIEGDSEEEIRDFGRSYQGTRHVPGVKAWGPYQQAQHISQMLAEGRDLLAVRSEMGLSTTRANQLRRVYSALDQMRSDPEYSDFAKPHLFSQFDEALKKPQIREWLQFDEQTATIVDPSRKTAFYEWIVGPEEDGERLPPKVQDAKDFRFLPRVLEDAAQSKRFLEDPRLSLQAAARATEDDDPNPVDWRGVLRQSLRMLAGAPAVEIAAAEEADRALLEEVRATCEQLLHQMKILQGAGGELTQ